jgi:hypothetical protein
MKNRGKIWVDPAELGADREEGDVEFVIPFIEPDVTRQVLARAAGMTAGLNARFLLVAVHCIPYPANFGEPGAIHAYLVEQLMKLCDGCGLAVSAHVVMARDRQEGYRQVLKPHSTVLVGSRRRWWRTTEESLARSLSADGHNVVLVHVEAPCKTSRL